MTSNAGSVRRALEPYIGSDSTNNVLPLGLPGFAINGPPSSLFADLPLESLAEGLETDVEEIRSAVASIPASAIANEPDWMNFARGLAHEAAIFKNQADTLWEILDTASRKATGYDQAENRARWLRYISEAFDRENPITLGTVFHMALEHGWRGWSPSVTAPAPQLAWSLADLRVSFANIRHRRWLYGTYLTRGEITVVAAPGGAGKTAYATGVAVEVATDTQILQEKIFGSGLSVLFINGEDAGTEIVRRIWAFHLAHAHKLTGKSLGRLYVAGADDPRVQRLSFLQTTDRNFSVLDRNGFRVLEEGLVALRPDLLILDPLVAFCGGGNMNDNSVMSQVMRELKRLATKFDCATLLVHHTRKGAEDGNPEAISGASATVNLARRALMPVIMTLEEMTKFGILPSERTRHFKLVDAKSNLAPRSADSPWYRLHSVELPNPEPPIYPLGDNVQAVVRVNLLVPASAAATQDDQHVRDAILDIVERGKMIGGRSYPYSSSTGGANNERALLPDAVAAARTATAPRDWVAGDLEAVVKGTIKQLTVEGLLIAKDMPELIPHPGRFRKGRGLAVARSGVTVGKVNESGAAPAGNDLVTNGGQLVNARSIDDQSHHGSGGGQCPPL